MLTEDQWKELRTKILKYHFSSSSAPFEEYIDADEIYEITNTVDDLFEELARANAKVAQLEAERQSYIDSVLDLPAPPVRDSLGQRMIRELGLNTKSENATDWRDDDAPAPRGGGSVSE